MKFLVPSLLPRIYAFCFLMLTCILGYSPKFFQLGKAMVSVPMESLQSTNLTALTIQDSAGRARKEEGKKGQLKESKIELLPHG